MLRIKEVEGFEDYTIDTDGNVYSKRSNKYLKPQTDKYGYYKLGLRQNKKQRFFFLHRLIAQAFIPNPNNYPVVNHIDGNKKNNSIENLEWCTYQENTNHAYRTGIFKAKGAVHIGEKNPNKKLTEQDVLDILKLKKEGLQLKNVYEKYKEKIKLKGFKQVWYRDTWKYLDLVERI